VSITDRLQDLDHRQQNVRGVRFIAAVLKKFGDDQAGKLAALISYYGFVSLFPLLLVFVTVLGFVLEGDPDLQKKILDGTLGQFPVLSDSLQLHSLKGSPAALVIGIIGALMAGLGIMSATQHAMDRIWAVPFKERHNFLTSKLRGLAMFGVLGTLAVASTAAAGFVGAASHGTAAVIGGVMVALVFNLILFGVAFKLLTSADPSWRELAPGVVTATVLWQLLQHLGGFYIDHTLKRTQPLYGFFAVVLGLLAWLYLGAQFTVFSAEINVVKARKLWPRSFFGAPLLDADRRALTDSAEIEERVQQETVDVSFDDEPQPR
jgi:membrane protein